MTTETLAFLGFYMLPSLLAWARSHPSTDSIAVVNLFLGWTFFGWVGALAWSVHGGGR
jgi:hypothetical protein